MKTIYARYRERSSDRVDNSIYGPIEQFGAHFDKLPFFDFLAAIFPILHIKLIENPVPMTAFQLFPERVADLPVGDLIARSALKRDVLEVVFEQSIR
jgi:hypothetical protein